MIGIYTITNIQNSKKYVGSSINTISRWRQHKNRLNKNTHHSRHLQNAWNKYGKNNFEFKLIRPLKFPESLVIVEQVYFLLLKPEYNLCPTAYSNLGLKHSKSRILKKAKAYYLKDPKGVIYFGLNLTKFCRGDPSLRAGLSKVLNGKRKHYKKWTAVL